MDFECNLKVDFEYDLEVDLEGDLDSELDFAAALKVDSTMSALGSSSKYKLEIIQSLFASRTRKNKAKLTVSCLFVLALAKADIKIETILSSTTLLLKELLLCLLYAK